MKKCVFLFLFICLLFNLCYGTENYEIKKLRGGTLTGDIRIIENFHSAFLNNDRTILVYLPPGYSEDNGKKYPVLYLQDGQNVFNKETSFIGVEWNLDETAERLIKEGEIREIIMVAIYNNKDRISEYTPVKDAEHGGGKLPAYADFVVKELKPFIDSNFNTSTEPSDTGFMGSSLGGISALYMGWHYPHIFGLIGVVSPSLWWSDGYFIREIAGWKKPKPEIKIWLDMGTEESDRDDNKNDIPDAIDSSRLMRDILINKGYIPGEDLFYYEAEGAPHNEKAWSERADGVMIFLLGKD